MERKLLSLPSFFVLLLVAGIAFLAAPVADVHATAPALTSAGMTAEVSGSNLVVTIPFTEAIKVSSGATTAAGNAGNEADGFGFEDLEIKRTLTAPTAAAETTVTVAATALVGQAAAGTVPADAVFKLTVPLTAAAVEGTIKVTIKRDAAFQDGDTTDAYPTTGDVDEATFPVDTLAPSVTIALAPGVTGRQTGSFEIRITLSQAAATTGAGVFNPTAAPAATTPPTPATADTGDITIVGASLGTAPEGLSTEGLVTRIIITPDADVEEVQISVAANAVMDANGNGNVATDQDAQSAGAQPLTVEIDNTHPTVTVAPSGRTGDNDDNISSAPFSAGTATTFEIRVTFDSELGSARDADFNAADDLTVTGGSVSGSAIEDHGTLSEDYLVKIAQDDTTTTSTVEISVPAGVVTDAAGNGNVASESLIIAVTGGDAPTPPPETDPGDTNITSLSGNRDGFEFTVNLTPTNRFMVLSNGSAEEAGFTNAVTFTRVKDSVWEDLRRFLVGREGGTIDLIGPTSGANAAKVRSLVISEMMWGNDDGLPTPADSQWIELYNTTGGNIQGTWELEFRSKHRGGAMDANDKATSVAKPVVDKLSTWRISGSDLAWRIQDTAGGSHGQSGKSTLNSATSPGRPVELVSMQRKIDYAKVLKSDHNTDDLVKNREEQLKGIPDGAAEGSWEAATEHGDLLDYRKGTPGEQPVIQSFDTTSVPRGSVVFNEIANRSDKKYDWIELHNKSGSDKNITGWELSVVSIQDSKRDDRELFTFTAGSNGDNIVVPAKGYLLIVNTDPRNTPLEGGYDVVNPGNSARESDGAGDKPSRLYYVSDKLDIPKERFLLILRNGNDKTGTHEKIEDIAGNNPAFTDETINTQVWPLRSWTLGATNDLGEKNDKTWTRDQGKAVFNGDEWKDNGGFTGVGIDRKYKLSDNYTSGTPGYANNAVQSEVKTDGLTEANPVIISEIMFATGNGRVPQWIELHNLSHTQAVNLKGWKLDIINYFGDETLKFTGSVTLTLPEVRIQPNQTVLIVSTTGRNSGSDEFPDDRLINIWDRKELSREFGQDWSRNDAFLSSIGFYLKLSDPRKTKVDEVGNISDARRSTEEPKWDLPGGDLDTDRRSSMVRVQGSENDGREGGSWRDASQLYSNKIKADDLYYGDDDDYGTPGYTPGGVLPVQLSSFYSKRNDAGAVIITWATESELDNAGFNILRSVSRSGEFTKINAQLIPGAGTTGEKNTYTWTDTSAKPNVVYYYQIEDVSLDGEHRTLRTTRLRGYVGAAGKATTIWGELKSRD